MVSRQKEVLCFDSGGGTLLIRRAAEVTCKNQEIPSFPYYLIAHWLAHEQSRQEQCVVRCHFHLPK